MDISKRLYSLKIILVIFLSPFQVFLSRDFPTKMKLLLVLGHKGKECLFGFLELLLDLRCFVIILLQCQLVSQCLFLNKSLRVYLLQLLLVFWHNPQPAFLVISHIIIKTIFHRQYWLLLHCKFNILEAWIKSRVFLLEVSYTESHGEK